MFLDFGLKKRGEVLFLLVFSLKRLKLFIYFIQFVYIPQKRLPYPRRDPSVFSQGLFLRRFDFKKSNILVHCDACADLLHIIPGTLSDDVRIYKKGPGITTLFEGHYNA